MIARYLLAAATALFAPPLCAESIPPEHLDLRGTEIFRALLKHRGLEPVILNQPGFNPKQTVLVIIGDVSNHLKPHLADLSRKILANGGAVLIVSGCKSDVAHYFPTADAPIYIDGRTVIDPQACLHNKFEQPLIRFSNLPVSLADQDLLKMAKLGRVAASQSSFLFEPYRPHSLVSFGLYSETAQVDGIDRRSLCVMGIAPVETMTAVVLASEGIVSNESLANRSESRTENFEFAMHLSAYLASGPNRENRRSKCLFFENNRFRTDFDCVQLVSGELDIRPSWMSIQKTIAENAESKLNELQSRDFPTQELLRKVRYMDLLLKIITATAILAALWVLRHAWSGRGATADDASNKSLDVTVAIWDSNNFYAAAREKIRLQFLTWGLSDGEKPVLAITGSYFYRKRMERIVLALEGIAFGNTPLKVSKNRWVELDLWIRDVDEAITQGYLRFQTTEYPS